MLCELSMTEIVMSDLKLEFGGRRQAKTAKLIEKLQYFVREIEQERDALAAHVQRFSNVILSDRFPDESAQQELLWMATRGKPEISLAEIISKSFADGSDWHGSMQPYQFGGYDDLRDKNAKLYADEITNKGGDL